MPLAISIDDIIVADRLRYEMGDVQSLANSIKEFGILQPAVIVHELNNKGKYRLVAGGRRLAALRLLGVGFLEIGTHVLVKDEPAYNHERDRNLLLKSMELEENLKRKDMTWAEQIEAKRQLFDLMTEVHGHTGAGRPNAQERAVGEVTGFGIRKLAAMLSESVGAVSQDLELAKRVRAMPHLAKEESKSSARRLSDLALVTHLAKADQAKLNVGAQASGPVPVQTPVPIGSSPSSAPSPSAAAAPAPTPTTHEHRWKLYEGRWQDSIHLVPDNSIDLVYTDLPYGVNLDEMRTAGASDTSSGHSGAISYEDDRQDIVDQLPRMMLEAYRVMKDNRFCVFWFGFNFYNELVISLRAAGFNVNVVPFVWIKHSQSAIAPTMRYANGYEQAIVAMKGSPRFICPGKANIADIPKISSTERLQFAQQPIPLVERFIVDMTLPIGASVLDFCSGVGTTGVAALKQGRTPTLFEKDPQQCLLSRQRLLNCR